MPSARPAVPTGQGCIVPSPEHQCASAQSASEVHVELPVADDVPAAQGLQLDWPSSDHVPAAQVPSQVDWPALFANVPAAQATQASTPLCEQPGALERPDGQSAHLLHLL
jgi:hypothetical protein